MGGGMGIMGGGEGGWGMGIKGGGEGGWGDGDKGRTELFATNPCLASQSVTKMTNVCNWSVFKVSVSLLNGKKKRERFCCVILGYWSLL